ncbi:hypothetical protein F4680DRAFT_312338 [Xylaria scruposa]|nr:hypothetical protein F4680DRAFT_312338 [Xylaria scruposa]
MDETAGPEDSSLAYVFERCPFEGEEFAWQRDTESIDDFLTRLPPSQTWARPGLSSIWISNPNVWHAPRDDAENQHIPGAEDEMPTYGNLAELMESGEERLTFLSSAIEDSQKPRVPFERYMLEKASDQAGAAAARDILKLAQDMDVTFGKWLVFCDTQEVDQIWNIIVHATRDDKLGIAAKFAARTRQDSSEPILICVYTYDFEDKEDVRRVAMMLEELGVIKANDTLYYQPGQFINPAERPFSRFNCQE